MNCHRIEELLELLAPVWDKHEDLHLVQMLRKLAQDAGYEGQFDELKDDILIYHLKMLETGEGKMIPGLAKDQEDDFKKALLQARGIKKD